MELVGKELVGWRVESWYELRIPMDEFGRDEVGGYFTDKNLAMAAGRRKGWFGKDGTVADVLVLTKDGKSGFVIARQPIQLSDEEATTKFVQDMAIKRAKEKLTMEELILLGIK